MSHIVLTQSGCWGAEDKGNNPQDLKSARHVPAEGREGRETENTNRSLKENLETAFN